MLNIIVCIKQVPMVSELPWDSKTGTVRREVAGEVHQFPLAGRRVALHGNVPSTGVGAKRVARRRVRLCGVTLAWFPRNTTKLRAGLR